MPNPVMKIHSRASPGFFILLAWFLVTLVNDPFVTYAQVQTGAEQTERYLSAFTGKKIGLVINQGSRLGNRFLLDSLLLLGVKVKKIFVPEHGFRGKADAGESLPNSIDSATNIPIISLYGGHTMPDSTDLEGIDLMVFDLQDVGARYYTYLSTLHYVIKSCARFQKPLMILDCPNPNGALVDGPVAAPEYRSFVGLDPVPILYGMTIGEYAAMVSGENWVNEPKPCPLSIIKLHHYERKRRYVLPVAPSPNLPNALSIALYPSLCLFEGTVISVGRGTGTPFQVFGHPDLKNTGFSFRPQSLKGKSKHPPYEGVSCNGYDLYSQPATSLGAVKSGLTFRWLMMAYRAYQGKTPFFNAYFEKLAGNGELRHQLMAGLTEAQIRKTWQVDLDKFKLLRNKYLLYR